MKRVAPFFLLLVVFAVGAVLRGQQTPDQTLAQLKPAPGLEVKLFASEPMVTNPTDMTVDERGRVWVLEGANYRRTQRQLPDIRPAGDRIVILEDTNNDGKADNAKVFDQDPKIRVPLGIAVLGDKVYVAQSPDIIVYTKDANDKILKKEVLLTGFNGIDHDHGLHAIQFGPDGKYYFNQGNTGLDVTDKSGKRVFMQTPAATGGGGGGQGNAPAPATPPTGPGYFQGVVMRMNADGTGLEVLGQNFRNPYEVAVDSWGNVWQTDNDDDGYAWTRLMYNMEGGNYGYRGPLNKTWSEDHGTHWHQELPGVAPLLYRIGAGSPCGLLVYEGKLLPAKYRGQLMHADAGKRIVAMYPLEERGAGFEGRSEDILNGGDDTWARPSDVAVAPDGALFVADWYDPGVGGHLMGDDGTRGRVYRIAPVGNKPTVPALNLNTPAGLTAAFRSGNMSTQFLAYTAIKSKGQASLSLLQSMWRQTADPILRARALWLLGGLGDAGSAAIQEAMKSAEPNFRVLGLRVARATGADMLTFSKPFLRDPAPKVRREIALMLQDPTKMLPAYAYPAQVQPSAEWLDAMATLASQYDGKDRWYLEALGIAARGREDALYARLKAQTTPRPAGQMGQLVWEMRPKAAIPDLVATLNSASAPAADKTVALDTLGNMEWPEATRAVETFILASATPPALAEHAFEVYSHQLFSLWTDARKSPSLAPIMRKAFTLPGAQSAAVTLADSLNDPALAPELLTLAKTAAATPEARAAAIDSLSYARDAQKLADFKALAESGPTPVRVAAVRAVAALGQTRHGSLGSDARREHRAQRSAVGGAAPHGRIGRWPERCVGHGGEEHAAGRAQDAGEQPHQQRDAAGGGRPRWTPRRSAVAGHDPAARRGPNRSGVHRGARSGGQAAAGAVGQADSDVVRDRLELRREGLRRQEGVRHRRHLRRLSQRRRPDEARPRLVAHRDEVRQTGAARQHHQSKRRHLAGVRADDLHDEERRHRGGAHCRRAAGSDHGADRAEPAAADQTGRCRLAQGEPRLADARGSAQSVVHAADCGPAGVPGVAEVRARDRRVRQIRQARGTR